MNHLKAFTFLAPNMLPVYQAIIKCLSDRIGMAITLTVGDDDYRQFSECDLAFICGLTYVLRTPPYVPTASHEAFAAPIPAGARYQGQPIYYSDVIVRADSPYQHFADLRGASWAFNEPESQSGYGVTRYHLVQMGETNGFFGKVVQAGFHQTALHWVANGEIDAAAIDTLVLAVEMEAHPALATQLRVIDTLGPSTIQPFVMRTTLPDEIKDSLRKEIITVHQDAMVRHWLDFGHLDRWVAVTDVNYDDIRQMQHACEQAGLLTVR